MLVMLVNKLLTENVKTTVVLNNFIVSFLLRCQFINRKIMLSFYIAFLITR